jgi:hypothetical protein
MRSQKQSTSFARTFDSSPGRAESFNLNSGAEARFQDRAWTKMSTLYIFSKCVATCAARKFSGRHCGAIRSSRPRMPLLLFALMSFWLLDARAQIASPRQPPQTSVLSGEEIPAEIAIYDISLRPDSTDLPVHSLGRANSRIDSSGEVRPSLIDSSLPADILIAGAPPPRPRFRTRSALRQEFEYLLVEHSFRLAQDPGLRYQLAHGPFFQDWLVSFKGYDLKRWGDGDDFLVNDVAHPMQGAIASWIFLQNSPVGSTAVFGKDSQYWKSRLKGMAWAAAFEVQWKIGPLSESSIGNAGGWDYVPGCGTDPNCLNNPKYPPPTNNTGLSDWIVTPIVGTGWVIAEDVIDKYVVGKVAERNRRLGIVLRTALEPCRNFAGGFAGRMPWSPALNERDFVHSKPLPSGSDETEDSWRTNRRSVGVHFVNVNLPGVGSNCVGCRENYSGFGLPYGFRLFEHVYFDSEVNFFPIRERITGPSVEGLFGMKFGQQARHWGLFGKVRPGFVYYQKAWSGGENAHFTDLSRFALDAGGTFEIYPSRRSAFRFDFGTTLVRYLRDYPNPRISPIGSIISTDYYVTQGNPQFSAGYRIRF